MLCHRQGGHRPAAGAWRLFDEPQPRYVPKGDSAIENAVAIVADQRRHRRPGDILLPAEFYGAVRQQDAGGRLRFRPTGEQLLAAIHLFRGRVVQMDAGEGKTVAIAIAAALHAMLGRRVHRGHRQRLPGGAGRGVA